MLAVIKQLLLMKLCTYYILCMLSFKNTRYKNLVLTHVNAKTRHRYASFCTRDSKERVKDTWPLSSGIVHEPIRILTFQNFWMVPSCRIMPKKYVFDSPFTISTLHFALVTYVVISKCQTRDVSTVCFEKNNRGVSLMNPHHSFKPHISFLSVVTHQK